MKRIKFKNYTRQLIADTITPVGLYLRLRDKYPSACLLESSDYHSNKNNFSFICLEPLATISVTNGLINKTGLIEESDQVQSNKEVIQSLQQFIQSFDFEQITKGSSGTNGIFGYTNFDAVKYFDTVAIQDNLSSSYASPDLMYSAFRFILKIDHRKQELFILENCPENQQSELDTLEALIQSNKIAQFSFKSIEEERSNITNDEFTEMVTAGKAHCQRGDVFQIVLSRQFHQQFKGDEFNVYRALRAINPSPYLFYFDFGNFKIFGSSPEAQIKIQNEKAIINPIAGTFKRTGNDEQDQALAKQLESDPKENAEHTMLVDLARNDLSKHGSNVAVTTYKETQFYSHVMHLVSEVEATGIDSSDSVQIFADTFPAGTLSGAPKYRALELIDQYENQSRGFYGGSIGYFGFDGSVNQAITIRSFLSKHNTLYYQAGAGIVVSSSEENELQEVNNKLGALKQAIKLAEEI